MEGTEDIDKMNLYASIDVLEKKKACELSENP
jgi:hypothetical protein